jgi:hypothetical protein
VLESNQPPPPYQRGARPTELPAHVRLRDKDSNPDLHDQNVASFRLDDPETSCCFSMSRPARKPNDVFQATRLPFNPGSAFLQTETTSYVEGFWSPFLGSRAEMCRQKQTHIRQGISGTQQQRIFLSQAGPRFDLALVQAEHHLLVSKIVRPPDQQKGDPLGRPRLAHFAARELARAAPREGFDRFRIRAKQIRQSRRGSRRLDGEHVDVGFEEHDARRRIEHGSEIGKSSKRRSNERSSDGIKCVFEPNS